MARFGRGYPIRPLIAQRAGAASAYATAVLADTPLLYWRLGETSGTTAADSSGNAHDGTYVGPPTLGAGSLLLADSANKAITVLANSGQRATIASAAWMNVSSLTAEAWVNFTSAVDATNGDAILSRYDGTGFNWILHRSNTGFLAAQLRNNSGTAYNLAGPAPVLGATYHAAFTFDGSTFALYVNGVQVDSVAVTGTVQTGSAPIETSQYSGASSTTPGATIDEAAVYGTALSAARLLAHYNAGIGAYAAAVLADAPLAYWKLDETSGAFADSSGNVHPGAVTGTPTYGGVAAASAIGGTSVAFVGASNQFGATTDPHTWWGPQTAWTVEGWFKTTSGATDNQILGRDDTGTRQFQFRVSNGQLQLIAFDGGGNARTASSSASTYNDGSWHHAVGVAQNAGTALTLTVYIDGAQVGTSTTAASQLASLGAATLGIYLAARSSTTGGPFTGSLDELAVYGTALSSTRVLAHYNVATGATGPTTVTGAVAMSAQAGMGVSASIIHDSANAMSAQASLAAAPTLTHDVASAMSAQASMVAGGQVGTVVTMSALASLLASPSLTHDFAAAMSARATLSDPGALTIAAAAALSAQASLGIITAHDIPGASALSAQASFSVSTSVFVPGAVPMSVTATLGVIGIIQVTPQIPPAPVSVVTGGVTTVAVTVTAGGIAYTSAYAHGQTAVLVSALGRQTASVLAAGATVVSVLVSARQLVGVGPVNGGTVVTLLYTPDNGEGNNAGNDTPLFGNDPQISNNQPVTVGVALTGNYISGEES